MINGWFPPESQAKPENYISGAEHFSLFVRETVKFPKFGVTLTNMPIGSVTVTDYINRFYISDLLREVNSTIEDVQQLGIVIGITSTWDCNLDHALQLCKPKRK
jgi:P2X purinoceptor 3